MDCYPVRFINKCARTELWVLVSSIRFPKVQAESLQEAKNYTG